MSKKTVRIENDGQAGYATKITDAETGEIIPSVDHVEITIDVRAKSPRATLCVHAPVVDVVADADIKQVCALCGRSTDEDVMNPEHVASLFHGAYERLAPQFHYQTRKASAVDWSDVPKNNKLLMIAVAEEVMKNLGIL